MNLGLAAGPALASAGPDLKHFCGAPLNDVQKFLRVNQGIMVEVSDVTKVKLERVTPRPLQQRLQ